MAVKKEDIVIKLNEIKLNCLKFFSLNSVAFSAGAQIKIDL